VSDAAFLPTMAGALAQLDIERALLVAGEDGLDEISATAPTQAIEVSAGELRSYELVPEELGIDPAAARAGELAGGSPEQNAAATRAILAGGVADERPPGLDLALVNAGAAIYVAGRAGSIADGVRLARETIADGRASAALERYVEVSVRLAPTEAVR
jgi:anthranilate phosphoribosyltransferase